MSPTPNDSTNTAQASLTSVSQDELATLTQASSLPKPYPQPILQATFKAHPTDFQVDEMMEVELTGVGEHLWMHIKKGGMNTTYVAQQLAKWAHIPSRDVGYSGMKDRHAVTTQWFSLRLPTKQLPSRSFSDYISAQSVTNNKDSANKNSINEDFIDVLAQEWHSKKLNRGTHKANRFIITLRDVLLDPKLATTVEDVDKVLTQIKTNGLPNYFGEQRFGRRGNNITEAVEWFEQGTIGGRKPHPKNSRDKQSILLSAARSAIFNQILKRRVLDGSWNGGLEGDVFNLAGTGSVFSSDKIDDTLKQRLTAFDIHPTGPLWGIQNDKVTASAKGIEADVIASNPILQTLAQGLEQKQIKTMRRSFRLMIQDMDWQWSLETGGLSQGIYTDENDGALDNKSATKPTDSSDNRVLILRFTLPTGAFATSVLTGLVQQLNQ